jgi:hypothetical protein
VSASPAFLPAAEPPAGAAPRCQRCGFALGATRPMGCKNPCANCGTVYPLGDCSD